MSKRFKAHEVDNQRFYMIPKSLFDNPHYEKLSLESRVVYALLRDRMELSRKNGWVDDDGFIYLLFSRESIAAVLNCCLDTVTKAMRQLIKFELIDEIRQGQGKPNIIYVCHVKLDDNNAAKPQNPKLSDSRNRYIRILDSENIGANDTEYNETNFSDTNNIKASTPSIDGNNIKARISKDNACSSVFTNKELEAREEILNYFTEEYEKYLGEPHPYYKKELLNECFDNLTSFFGFELSVCVRDTKMLIDDFFKYVPLTGKYGEQRDLRFALFCSTGILQIRQESCRTGGL